MNKKQIIKRMSEIINSGEDKKLTKSQVEKSVEALKQVMLECVENGIDFDYHGFIEVITTIDEPKERRNPKTGDKFMDGKKYRASVKFKHSVKKHIKDLKVK